MKLSWAKVAVCLFAITFFLGLPAQAQLTTGSVTGTVVDATGAVIPGATVTLSSEGTGVTREQETSGSGSFNFDRVRPGSYTLRISKSGFRTHEVKDVGVSVGKVSAFGNVALEVGATAETVTVEAGAVPLMQAESPQIIGTYSARTISDVTFGTFGLDSTAFLTAGIVPGFGNINTNTGTFVQATGTTQIPGGSAPAASGQRARSTQFSVDGHEINDITLGGPNVFLTNLDTVAEYQVVVNNFDASQGRLPGAQINVVTKSGTNDFHGTAFYFYESAGTRSSTSGEDRFAPTPGNPYRPKFVDQFFGGTFGGPIVKNKFFGFGSFSRFHVPPSASSLAIGSDRALLQSEAVRLNGNIPNTATAMYMNAGPFSRPDGNPRCNAAPTSVFMGAGSPYLACAITRNVPNEDFEWEYLLKFDLVLSKQTFTGKWYHHNTFFCCSGGSNGYFIGIPDHEYDFNFSHTYQLSPRAINDFRFSTAQLWVAFEGGNTIPGAFIGTSAVRGNLARINLPPGFLDFGLATNLPQGRMVQNFQWQDNVSYIWGRHTLKAGMEVRRNRTTAPFLPTVNGQYNFTTMTNFGLNAPSSINFADGPFAFQPKETDQFYYVQDDIRIRPNFTLNLGLRYEYTGQPINIIHDGTVSRETGVNGQIPFWLASLPLEDRTFPKIEGDKNNWGPRVGFAYTPRFWKRIMGEDKTVIRGGYLVAYEAAFYNILLNVNTSAPNVFLFLLSGFPVQGGGTGADLAAFAAPLIPFGTRDPREFSRTIVPTDFRSPYTENWSLGVQREFGSSIVAEARYVGSRQIGQFQSINANPRFDGYVNDGFTGEFPAGAVPCSSATDDPPTFLTTIVAGRINCSSGLLRERINGGKAIYHGLQTRLDYRNLFNQLTGGVSFVWSKTIDNVSEIFGFLENGQIAFSENPFHTNTEERGLSNIHLGRVFTAHYIWDAPWHRDQKGIAGKVLGGWQINGEVFLIDGRPWTPSQFFAQALGFIPSATRTCGRDQAFNNTFAGLFDTCRPYLGNPAAPVNTVGFVGDPNAHWWLNMTELGPRGVGRNPYLYGDGLGLANMSFFKNNKVGPEGKYNLQLRVQVQNIFNHRNFGIPDGFIEDTHIAGCNNCGIRYEDIDVGATFGTPSKNDAAGRLVRLGLRFVF